MSIALLRLCCLTFLVTRIPRVVSSRTSNAVNQCHVIADEAEMVVNSFRDQFQTLLSSYEQDQAAILDNIQQVTNDLLAKWEQENNDLAQICSTTTTQSTTLCHSEAASLELQRKKEIEMVAIDLPQQKRDAMQGYLSEFIQLEIIRLDSKSKLDEALDSIHNIFNSFGRKARARIEPSVNEDINRIEMKMAELEEIESQLHLTIEELNTVVFGDICFEFVGATNSIEYSGTADYNDAMKKSLEFSLIKEKMDMEVIGFEFVEEILTDGYLNHRRILNELSPYADERALGRVTVRSANVVGFNCRCKTDSAVSDVTHRRNLEENGRKMMFSSELMTTLATVLREELPENFAHLEYVSTFHCSDFEMQSAMQKLASVDTHVFLRLPGHSCGGFKAKGLGTQFATPQECSAAAIVDPACTGNEIMWSQAYNSNWGCKCCLPNPMPGGDEAYTVKSVWDIYQYKELEEANGAALEPSLVGYSCNDFQAKNLGAEFATPQECSDAAIVDPACTGNEIMWSQLYNSNWGCRCCLPNPNPHGIEAYIVKDVWNIYQYKELEVREDAIEPTLVGYSCNDFQAKNLGTEFATPQECSDAASADPFCTGNEIMWTQRLNSKWGCRCCLPNPNPDYGLESYTANEYWSIYKHKESETEESTGLRLRLPGHSCTDIEAKNLGTEFATPQECGDAAMVDPACTGNEIMWSSMYNNNWGCRCCLHNPNPDGMEAYAANGNWAVYEYKAPEERTDFRLRLKGHNCEDFQAKNLGTFFGNAEQCADTARHDSLCTGDEIMWSQYSDIWGCWYCLPNPGVGDEEYKVIGTWDIYEYH